MTARSRSRTKRAAAAARSASSPETRFHRREPAEAGGHDRGPRPFFFMDRDAAGESRGLLPADSTGMTRVGLTAPSTWRPGRPSGTGVLSRVGSRHPSGAPLEAALGTGVLSRWFAASSGPPWRRSGTRWSAGAPVADRWRTLPRRGGPREFRGPRQQQSNATSYHEGDSKSPASEGRLRRPRPTSHLQSSWSTDPPHRKKGRNHPWWFRPFGSVLRLAESERIRTANRPAPRRPRAACPP